MYSTPISRLIGSNNVEIWRGDESIALSLDQTPENVWPIWRASTILNWLGEIFRRSPHEQRIVFHLIGLNTGVRLYGADSKTLSIEIVMLMNTILDGRYRPINRVDDIAIRIFKAIVEECNLPKRLHTIVGCLISGQAKQYEWLQNIAALERARSDPFDFTSPGDVDEAFLAWHGGHDGDQAVADESVKTVIDYMARLKAGND